MSQGLTSLDLRSFCRAPASTAAAGWTGGELRRLLAGVKGAPCSRDLFLVFESWFGDPVLLPGTLLKIYLRHSGQGALYSWYH